MTDTTRPLPHADAWASASGNHAYAHVAHTVRVEDFTRYATPEDRLEAARLACEQVLGCKVRVRLTSSGALFTADPA